MNTGLPESLYKNVRQQGERCNEKKKMLCNDLSLEIKIILWPHFPQECFQRTESSLSENSWITWKLILIWECSTHTNCAKVANVSMVLKNNRVLTGRSSNMNEVYKHHSKTGKY